VDFTKKGVYSSCTPSPSLNYADSIALMAKKNILTLSKKKKSMELAQGGQFAEAKKLLEEVCRVDRVDEEAWFMLGIIHGKLNDVAASIASLRQAIKLRPGHPLSHYNLGMALHGQGQLDEAIGAFQEAVHLAPQQIQPQVALSDTLLSAGRIEEAAVIFRNLTRLHPTDVDVLARLGRVVFMLGNLEEAISCYRKVLQLNPGYASVHDNIGRALCNQGLIDDAIASHRQALRLTPDDVVAHSNLLLTLQYQPQPDAAETFAEHRRWVDAHMKVPITLGWANNRDPKRRLKVGYFSADFRTHSVAFFFEPLLANHDANAVETFCYSAVLRPDAVTERLQGLADEWRSLSSLTDVQVAEMIRADGIDILVDLAGHTGNNALKVFARKPAPIQATYLGYPDTTGLSTIDYRMTDALSDPPGREAFFTESLVHLPGCFLCYKPLPDAPEVAPLPALEKGYVTFGSFNMLPKINRNVIALWTEALRSVPDSRLFIKSPPLTDNAATQRYYDLFEAQGIGRDRVELIGRTATQAEHLDLYKRLDIALDTFPYNGTTTTCEALWMGVPVVTLAGVRHSGRVGVSLLNAAGLEDWIAETPEQYVAIAARMAADIPHLAELRAGLRERTAASPLCEGKPFALKVEAAYREMWRKYCVS
jgi:protein O-GlcNAc transferase